jgi:hypothetical protein
MLKTLVAALACCMAAPAFADDAPVYDGAPGCRFVRVLPGPPATSVHWNGQCRDGFAEGPGKVELQYGKRFTITIEATLARGDISGEATMTSGDGTTYIGLFKSGMPDGHGYLKWPNGDQFEGNMRQGKRSGPGTFVHANGNVFKGSYENDHREGHGRVDFALGGSCEGEYRDGNLVGRIKVVHAGSGRVFEGDAAQWHPGQPSVATSDHFVRYQDPPVGTKIPTKAIDASLPLTGGWEKLTTEQKQSFRSQYVTLEEGDEPPYPVTGVGDYSRVALAAAEAFGHSGNAVGRLRLYVLVGKNGSPLRISQVGTFDKDITRYVAAQAMNTRFKPAMCHGEPCDMMYPIAVDFNPR